MDIVYLDYRKAFNSVDHVGRPKKCAQCEPPLPALGNEQDSQGGSSVHCSINSVSPATPAMCSSRAAASASNRMCETAAYQLAPLFHTQHYVPFVSWNEQPFFKTTGTIVIIYGITSFFYEFCIAHVC